MRRKAILLAVLAGLSLGGIGMAQIWSPAKVNSRETSNITTSENYQPNLKLRIGDATDEPAYELSFDQDFQKATITLRETPLTTEAYVRILDEQGALVKGEYTEMREIVLPDESPEVTPEQPTGEPEVTPEQPNEAPEPASPVETPSDSLESVDELPDEPTTPDLPPAQEVRYFFTNAPATYTLALQPGYVIEVRSAQAHFYSTLDGQEVSSFAPTAATERYVVTEKGLKRDAWSDAEAEEQLYQILKAYLVAKIERYQAETPAEILDNKTADLVAKTQVITAYLQLRAADQTPYTEFIEHLKRGGSPVITYRGATQYELGATLDLLRLIEVYDNEDGDLTYGNLIVTTNLDPQTAGQYYLLFTAIDSDHNESSLRVEIKIIDPNAQPPLEIIDPNPIEKLPEIDLPVELPSEPVQDTPVDFVEPETPFLNNSAQDPIYSAPDDSEATVGGGLNVDAVQPDPDDQGTVFQPEEQPTNHDQPSKDSAEPGLQLSTLLWMAFAAIALILLIRFVFDHYVR